jgi:hypothetical protein
MPSTTSHIRLIFTDEIPPVAFEGFLGSVSSPGLDLVVERRPQSGPFAGLDWLVPTGLILFIGQGYFNGFLSEMGKEHYAVLKDNLKALRDSCASFAVRLIGARRKAPGDQPYSLFYSIYFEDHTGRRFKFLVPNGEVGDPDAEQAMDAFGDFLAAVHSGELDADQKAMLADAPAFGANVLLAFNLRTGRIEPINPVTRAFGLPISHSEGRSLDPPFS